MSAPNISLNPLLTTNAAGLFSITSEGYTQGVALDDPAVRFALAGGVLASTETLPMWGGLPIFEDVPSSDGIQGGNVGRATGYTGATGITGWSVFNQAHNGLTTPQSNVPMTASGMTVNFYRVGSGARIAVPMNPALVSMVGNPINQQVSWDFTANQLVAFSTTALPVRVIGINVGNSSTVVYDAVNNYANWTRTGSVAIIVI